MLNITFEVVHVSASKQLYKALCPSCRHYVEDGINVLSNACTVDPKRLYALPVDPILHCKHYFLKKAVYRPKAKWNY